MTTRRNFLKGAAASGIAFCSCGMLEAAHAQPKAPRLPVKVGGKRVLTVDVHAHCYFREAINLMGDGADKVLPPVKGVPEHFIVIEQRLREMDAMAIDMEVLSINPFWYGKDRDTAAQIVKLQNEKLAELCAARPERFAAVGVEVETKRRIMLFEYPLPPADVVKFFAEYFGPTRMALARMDPAAQAAHNQALEKLWVENNQSDSGKTLIQNEYLEVIGKRT